MSSYPTVDEAIAYDLQDELHVFQESLLYWKKAVYKGWRNKPKDEKFLHLFYLGRLMTFTLFSRTGPLDEPNFVIGDEWTYSPSKELITMGRESPSIISLLHEIGHHIYGRSELKACAFSLQLFKKVFPNDWKKLQKEGHMMRKTPPLG